MKMSCYCDKAVKLLDFHECLYVLQCWMHSKVNVLWVFLFFFFILECFPTKTAEAKPPCPKPFT